ncbi:MAG: ribosome maturation factor RimM [Pseudomonadota bacterium]
MTENSLAVHDLILAGRISGAYGIKGWLRVHTFTESPESFLALSPFFRVQGSRLLPVDIEQGKVHGNGLVVSIAGVSDRSKAEELRGVELHVLKDSLPKLEDEDYYWSELIGLSVVTSYEGRDVLLGSVSKILETGANDVLVLCSSEGSVDSRERLVPYIDDVVLSIDLTLRRIWVAWHPDD